MSWEPSVAIIVLNWNGFADTCECLRSLQRVHYANRTVVLVDNGSANNEGSRLQQLFPEFVLIQNRINRGFSGGNNDGIVWAMKHGFEYIVNLNNDCIVEPSWLTILMNGVQQTKADFASPRIMYYPDTELVCSLGDRPLPDGSGHATGGCSSFQGLNSIYPIFSASGAASLYSMRCLEAIQIRPGEFFDELYFAYFEDIDVGMRLQAKSFKGVCVADAVVYHKGTRSAGVRSAFQLFHLEKNRMLNELLNFPLWLIPIGELWYVARLCLRSGSRFLQKASVTGRCAAPAASLRDRIRAFFKARLWVLAHAGDILKDRGMRKARGLLNKRIYKHVMWNLFESIH